MVLYSATKQIISIEKLLAEDLSRTWRILLNIFVFVTENWRQLVHMQGACLSSRGQIAHQRHSPIYMPRNGHDVWNSSVCYGKPQGNCNIQTVPTHRPDTVPTHRPDPQSFSMDDCAAISFAFTTLFSHLQHILHTVTGWSILVSN